jgi:hypothetical protein
VIFDRGVFVRPAIVAVALSALGCAATPQSPGKGPDKAQDGPPVSSAVSSATSSSTAPSTSTPRAGSSRSDAAAVFARLKSAFDACYQEGKKSTPTMLDGHLTLNASFDANGKTTCAIPTEASGITQAVEDCMSERLASESFGAGEPGTSVLPLVLHGGVLELADPNATKVTTLESVETRRMPDAFDVLEALVPKLEHCLHDLDRSSGIKSIVVAANIGLDGRTRCALASPNTSVLPLKVSACTVDAFGTAKFPPPKGGTGVILVPLNLTGR